MPAEKIKISKGRRRNSVGLYQGVDNSERAIVQLLDGETASVPQTFLVKLKPSGNLNWCIYFFSLFPSLCYVIGAPKVKLTDLDDNDVEVVVASVSGGVDTEAFALQLRADSGELSARNHPQS